MSTAPSSQQPAEDAKKPKILPGTEDWESSWAKGIARGMRWDIGQCEPELVYELALKEKGTLASIFAGKDLKGLVPGCGRGYAVTAMAQAGIQALGLDLSQTAMELARKECAHELATFETGDFFDETVKRGPFDLIFDSTFLCAISPLLWRQWAKRTVQLLAPGGVLAMQVFPVFVGEGATERDPDHPGDEPGPPNRLTIGLVRALLEPYKDEMEEIALRETPKERMARGNFIVRGESVKEYWMVFRRKALV